MAKRAVALLPDVPTTTTAEICIGDHVQIWYVHRGKASFRLARVEKIKNQDRATVRVVGKVKCAIAEISLRKDVFCVYKGEVPTED